MNTIKDLYHAVYRHQLSTAVKKLHYIQREMDMKPAAITELMLAYIGKQDDATILQYIYQLQAHGNNSLVMINPHSSMSVSNAKLLATAGNNKLYIEKLK